MSMPQHPRSDRRPVPRDDLAELTALVGDALAAANGPRPLTRTAIASSLASAERFGARQRQGGTDIVAIVTRFQEVRFESGISTAFDRGSSSVLDAVLVAIVRGFEDEGDGAPSWAHVSRRPHPPSGRRFERRIRGVRHRRTVHR